MARVIDFLFNSYFTPIMVIGLIILAVFLFIRARWLFRRLIIPMLIIMLFASYGTVNAASRTFMAPAQKLLIPTESSEIMPLADRLESKRKSMSDRLTERVMNSDFVKEIEQMCKDAMNDPAILYGGQDLSKYE